MKKVAFLLSVLFILLGLSCPASAEDLVHDVKAAMLVELSTGKVIYEQNADEQLYIASVTKIMTMLIAMEKIDSGELSLDDTVTGSKKAKNTNGSSIYVNEGEKLTVDDLLKAMAIKSANDSCVVMAEHIAGDTDKFVAMMNSRAKELGMNNTVFVNCNGLDDNIDISQAHSTARDVSIMAQELVKHRKIFDYSTTINDSLRNGTFPLESTNKQFLTNYQGATGLKTGYTSKAGYCLCATANRDGLEFLTVVLGANTKDARFTATKTLLDYGYDNYILDRIAEAGEKVGTVNVSWGEADSVTAKAAEGHIVLRKKTGEPEIKKSVKLENKMRAPVKEGDKLGDITFTQGGKTIKTIDILAGETVERKGFFRILLDILKMLFM